MREIREFVSPSGKRKVCLYERGDGRFCFIETYEDQEDLTPYGGEVITYWTPGFQSGIYEDVEAAERELRQITPWLEENSN